MAEEPPRPAEGSPLTLTSEEAHQPLLAAQDTLSTRNSEDSSVAPVREMRLTHFFGAVANLCSATLGAGVLALPFALYQAGLFFGCILLVCSAWATAVSIKLLIIACDRYQCNTYEKVVENVLGKRARQLVETSILIFCGGCAVAYLIAVGDILEQVEDMTTRTKHVAMSLVWLCAMLPLSCLKRMQSLQCASTVGIASIGILLLAASVHLIQDIPHQDGNSMESIKSIFELGPFVGPAHGSWLSVLRACPIVFFSFSCQVNVCQIYEELPTSAERSEKMSRVAWVAVGLCALLYTSISMVTLMDFGADLTPNVLSCYRLTARDQLLHVAFLAMALAVVMAFPLNIFPARVSVIQMISSRKTQDFTICGTDDECRQPLLGEEVAVDYNSGDDVEEGEPEDALQPFLHPVHEPSTRPDMAPEPEFHLGQHVFVTLLVSGGALVLALLIPNISVVFGLLGGTTSSLLGFVIPGLLGLQMDKKDWNSWILVVAGSIIGILTTGVTVYSTFQDLGIIS
jgi:amino acid permease